jgi:4-hydroxybenzoate polyprenyltransferase/phosphoserine phosphatase
VTPDRPIFIDLDGTLIRTDIFVEAMLSLLKANPLKIFSLVGWAMRGRSVAKTMVARQVRLDPSTLPYNQDVISLLTRERTAGRRIVLATAAHWKHARSVAKHLGIFDEVLASNARQNLKGKTKLRRIQSAVQQGPFTYGGDNKSDRPIWRAAETAIFVNAPRRDVVEADARGVTEANFTDNAVASRELLRAVRPHQWAKNALLAVPLFTSHSYFVPAAVLSTAIAFVCFCLCASGVYLLNDMLDIEADRRHRTKRRRPFAQGNLSLKLGLAGAALFPIAAFGLSLATLPLRFSLTLLIYYFLTNAYSLKLKSISTLDVFALSGLYTLRVIAGAMAIGVVLSSWLALFSLFFFLSLAYLKRYSELYELGEKGAPGRGYSGMDRDSVFALGVANGVASTLIMALYVQSEEVRKLYHTPTILLLVCVGLLYWLNRAWVGARRGKIHEDPVVFAFRDRISRYVGLLLVLVVVAAKYIRL